MGVVGKENEVSSRGRQSFVGGWRSGLDHRLSARGCAGGFWEGCGSDRGVSGRRVRGWWTFGSVERGVGGEGGGGLRFVGWEMDFFDLMYLCR